MTNIHLLPLFLIHLWQASGQCLDENGQDVDWVVMYKFPKNSEVFDHETSYINVGKNTLLSKGGSVDVGSVDSWVPINV